MLFRSNGIAETLLGNHGDDVITCLNGASSINGNDGNDTIIAGGGNDSINGEDGDDSISGGDGNDTIIATDGGDFLAGGDGNDQINAGGDDDVLTGAMATTRCWVAEAAMYSKVVTAMTTSTAKVGPTLSPATKAWMSSPIRPRRLTSSSCSPR